jgi:threonine aldolase
MHSFKNDYSVGAHPAILQKLMEINFQEQQGYGEDEYSREARKILQRKVDIPEADVYFLSGGTQTNLIVIASLLRAHEAVISATTGHIYANETGAIEATGHRVIAVDTVDGKLTPAHIQKVLRGFSLKPHVVKPTMVYISNPTEVGTVYRKSELETLSACCAAQKLLLYLDGARLGNALTADENDLTLPDIARCTDVFYIGGTKNGALLGEAVVFPKPHLSTDFVYVLKQRGALLAKGWLLGIQFLELFKDDLYFSLATHANAMAMKIATALQEQGYSFLTPSTTNQIFPIFRQELIESLQHNYDFAIWKNIDPGRSAIRLITSWATKESAVDVLISDLKRL